jgi:hypothetical protein
MPFHKVDAKENEGKFVQKHQEQKYMVDALDRYYEIRKNLVKYRKEHNISLEYISKVTLLSEERLRSLETGMDKNVVDYLLYARALGLSLYLQL